jgi:hypothetical protein
MADFDQEPQPEMPHSAQMDLAVVHTGPAHAPSVRVRLAFFARDGTVRA